jgi:ABC-type branched-subunit amino acid transport system ATPase component
MNGRYVKHRTQPAAKGTIGVVRAFQMERSFADLQIVENIMTTWENDFDKTCLGEVQKAK